MEEPLISTNAWKCRWPEKKSWWYRTSFRAPATFLEHERQQLIFDGLDLYAQVFLNGELLGEARNALPSAISLLVSPAWIALAKRILYGGIRQATL